MLKTIKNLIEEGIIKNGTMLDLGCGSGKDAIFASDNGFGVTAVDKHFKYKQEGGSVNFVLGQIEDFDIEDKKYDVIYADNSLPFLSKENVEKLLKNASSKLKEDGTFYFSLFGTNDAWANDKNMNFWTRDGAEKFVKSLNLKIYRKTEEEGFAPQMNGELKYWHIFRFILKK